MSQNNLLFLSTTITSTYVMASDETEVISQDLVFYSNAQDARTLLLTCADDDEQQPTIAVSISLKVGEQWSAYTEIQAATAVPVEFKIDSYDKSWWLSNQGVRFKLTKAGSGASTLVGTWT
jgi:hypothetical protein